MLRAEKIFTWIEKNQKLLLWGMIGLVSAAMICGVVVKYGHFGYNAMDLGIYSQVFFNTVQGRLFEFSVHPHSYLGDHFELFILFLSPLYALFRSPITLLVLQVFTLTVAAWPLFMIAKKILPARLSLLLALGWLINPFVWNMAFFEFHILPFAIIPLLFAYYFFSEKRFWPFVLCSVLSMTVREDVPLVVMMFGFLSLIERRSWKWVLLPLVSGGLWFIAAIQFTGFFNMYGSYKFLSMYPWLGSTLGSALKTLLTHPWLLVTHLVTFKNLLLAVGILLPLAALPIIKPKTLILSSLIAGQLFLSGFSPTVVLETHYTALLLPILFISAIYGLSFVMANNARKNGTKPLLVRYRWLYGIIVSSAMAYAFVLISPVATLVHSVFSGTEDTSLINIKKAAAQQITARDAAAVGYDYLAPLSNRERLYSLNYAFLGKKQYSDQDYRLPADTNHMILDASDFITYQLQYSDKPEYRTGADRIRAYIRDYGLGIDSVQDSVVTFSKNATGQIKLFEYASTLPPEVQIRNLTITDQITLLGWDKKNVTNYSGSTHEIELSMFWKLTEPASDNLNILFTLWDGKSKKPYEKVFPFGYGLAPTFNWPTDKIIVTNFWIVPPQDGMTLSASLVDISGYLDLDGWRSAITVFSKKSLVGPTIAL